MATFGNLTDRLSTAFKNLRGKGKRDKLFDNESIEDPAFCWRRA